MVESTGDWSAYRDVDLYFRPAPSEGLYDGHRGRTNVQKATYDHSDLVHMGRVEVSPYGTFAWKGQYPEYVRSKRLYIVVAVADDGRYAVWGEPFGWYSGPRKGIPDRPDGTTLAETLIEADSAGPLRRNGRDSNSTVIVSVVIAASGMGGVTRKT